MTMALDIQTATVMTDLDLLDENKITTKSSTMPGTKYSISLEGDLLISCSSQDYIKNMTPFKHLYLVHRIYTTYEIHYGGSVPERFPQQAQDAANNIDDSF
ncbi:hypothetical protein BGX27_007905 [Mortierella sp. AM989]|nr:hypothetical protein BGX27_007905 [Mortierella sp. AM989]